jgi:hypothetical protein
MLQLAHGTLAILRNVSVVDEAGGVNTETAAGEGGPEEAFVRAAVPVDIGLYPSITSLSTGGSTN